MPLSPGGDSQESSRAWAEASKQGLVEKWLLVHRDLRAPPPTRSGRSQPASRALSAQATTRNAPGTLHIFHGLILNDPVCACAASSGWRPRPRRAVGDSLCAIPRATGACSSISISETLVDEGPGPSGGRPRAALSSRKSSREEGAMKKSISIVALLFAASAAHAE